MIKKVMDITELAIGVLLLGILVSLPEKQKAYVTLSNPSRLKIFEFVYNLKKEISLMDLSRALKMSKTNIQFHIYKLEKVNIIKIERQNNVLRHPLKISVHPEIRELLNPPPQTKP